MSEANAASPSPLPGCTVLPPLDAPTAGAGRGGGKGRAAHRAAGGRFRLLNAFVDGALAGLGRAEVACWLVLFRDCRDGLARTSFDGIAERAGVSRRSVARAVGAL